VNEQLGAKRFPLRQVDITLEHEPSESAEYPVAADEGRSSGRIPTTNSPPAYRRGAVLAACSVAGRPVRWLLMRTQLAASPIVASNLPGASRAADMVHGTHAPVTAGSAGSRTARAPNRRPQPEARRDPLWSWPGDAVTQSCSARRAGPRGRHPAAPVPHDSLPTRPLEHTPLTSARRARGRGRAVLRDPPARVAGRQAIVTTAGRTARYFAFAPQEADEEHRHRRAPRRSEEEAEKRRRTRSR